MQISKEFILGTGVVAYVEVLDRLGAFTDPVALILRRLAPSGELAQITIGQLSRISAGKYVYEFVPNEVGVWGLRWESTNPTTASEGVFRIKPSIFP